MLPLPSFRTIITAILCLAVVSVGGTLSLTTYGTMLANSREFANAISAEVANASISNIENVSEYWDKGVKIFATIASKRGNDPLLPMIIREFWSHLAAGKFKNIALKGVFAADGHGFIIYRGDMELVNPDKAGGFTATSVSTGASRQITDMRELDWYRRGIEQADQDTVKWSPVREFVNLTNLDERRGFSIYTAFRTPEADNRVAGVIAISGSIGWIRTKLIESLGANTSNSVAFVLEKEPSKEGPVLLAHTDGAVGDMISRSKDAVYASDCGSALTSGLSEPLAGLDLLPGRSRTERVVTPEGAYHVTYTMLRPNQEADWILCHAIRESQIVNPAQQRLAVNLAVTFGIMAVVLAPAFWFAVGAARRLEQLAEVAEATGRLELDDHKPVRSGIREISQLASAVESMRAGLKSFLRYMPEDLIRRYLKPGNVAGLDGEVVPVTILFSDIKDFSSVAERMDTMTLVRHLNHYLEITSQVVSRHGGTVDKYIGDAVMSFWNAPQRVPRHAREAFAATLESRKVLGEARITWEKEKLPVFHTRVGIHTGDVIVGNIGSSVRLNYTIIGDAVNLASRLESLNKQYGTSILVSEPARFEAGEEFLTRPVDLVAVKGKSEPVLVHELMGWRSEATPEALELARLTADAHQLYRDRRFQEARDAYAAINKKWLADTLSEIMAEKAHELSTNPPPDNWSGVFRAKTK